MTQEVTQLKSQLSKRLNWNGARLDFLARLLISIWTKLITNNHEGRLN